MKFSIITPSYNQLNLLKLATASIRDQAAPQTGLTVEHLVQEAKVGEFTPNFLDEALGGSSPGYDLRVCVEKDEGMYDAINRGFNRASGEICAWLNCDEQYLPGTLEKVRNFFALHPDTDVVFGDAILVDLDGKALSYRKTVPPEPVHTRLVHLSTLSCATFFRRSLIERGFFFDTRWKMIGDAVWIEGQLEAEVPMAILSEPLATFAFTGVNQSISKNAAREGLVWGSEPGAPARWKRLPSVLWHRFSKWRAGAYRLRNFSYEIWEAGSNQRRSHEAKALGWSWPKG